MIVYPFLFCLRIGRQSLEGSKHTFENLAALIEFYRDGSQTDLPIALAKVRSTDV